MLFKELSIKGVYLITPEPYKDDRGLFRRHFCAESFKKNNIEFINSIPSSNFDDDDDNLFIKKSKGDLYSRIINQFSMIFNSFSMFF